MDSVDVKQWEQALEVEIKQLFDSGTVVWFPDSNILEDHSLIDAKVWKLKRNGSGETQDARCRSQFYTGFWKGLSDTNIWILAKSHLPRQHDLPHFGPSYL